MHGETMKLWNIIVYSQVGVWSLIITVQYLIL